MSDWCAYCTARIWHENKSFLDEQPGRAVTVVQGTDCCAACAERVLQDELTQAEIKARS